MEKSPFSLYDFLGYFFPGAFISCVFSLFYMSNSYEMINFAILIKSFKELKTIEFHFSFLIIIVVSCYIIGHLLAYLSSLSIERFALWLFGYPSEFLLGQRSLGYWNCNISTSSTENHNVMKNKFRFVFTRFLLRLAMLILLLPITLFHLFSKIVNLETFIKKPLDDFLKKAIFLKIDHLIYMLGLSKFNINQDADFSRIISHYVYERQKNHCKKLDNYVALYGFLRAMTLVFDIIVMYLLFYSFSHGLTLDLIILLICFSFITYVLFLSFIKFYRRYTLEGFMCLITDESLKYNEWIY